MLNPHLTKLRVAALAAIIGIVAATAAVLAQGAGAGGKARLRPRPSPGTSKRHGQPVSHASRTGRASATSAGRRDRHHPRRQGRHVAAPSIRAADPPHRRVGQRRQAVRRQDVRAGARLLPGPRRQLLGGRQRAFRRQSGDRRPRLPAVQVQPGRQGAADARQGRRVEGRASDTFIGPTACAIAPNGDIIVADGHWPRPTDAQQDGDRLVRFTKDGKFVAEYGKMGPGRASSWGRTRSRSTRRAGCSWPTGRTTACRSSTSDMKFVDEWRHFGRPSGIAILKDDTLIVADSESSQPIGGPPRRPKAAATRCAIPGGATASESAAPRTGRCATSSRAHARKGWAPTNRATCSPGSPAAATRARRAAACRSSCGAEAPFFARL